jgi:hypothetical protein
VEFQQTAPPLLLNLLRLWYLFDTCNF